MEAKYNFETLVEKAKNYCAQGHDHVYIGNQLAELNIGNDMIQRVIEKLKNHKRNSAKKFMLFGMGALTIGFILNIVGINFHYDFGLLVWFLPLIGSFLSIKGVGRAIGL